MNNLAPSLALPHLAEALIQFQSSVPTIHDNAESYHGGFANLPGVLSKIGPALRAAGLIVSQLPEEINGQPGLRTTLMHTSGEHVSAVTPLAINSGKNGTHEWGKSVTYQRRFCLLSVLGLCVGIEDNDADIEDNDADIAEKAPAKPAEAKPSAAPAVDREPLENKLIELLQLKMERGQTLEYLDHKAQAWGLTKGGSRVQQMNPSQLQTCIDELRTKKAT